MAGAYILFNGYIYYAQQSILPQKQEQIIATQKVVESKGSEASFIKLELARSIEAQNQQIPWAEHIRALVGIIQEIQETDFVGSNVLKFTDLSINDEVLTLKWEVTNLILLYHSVPEKNYISLIDRFNELDFVKTMKIKEYKKAWDIMQFTLSADISLENANK